MRHEPRDYQEEAIQSIFRYFEQGNTGNPLLVAPTGSGKSLMLAEFIRRAIDLYPETKGQPTRIIVVTHVKELIDQDFRAILRQWPEAPLGLHSAGMKRRDTRKQVIVAGIQSCYRKAADLYCDLVLIDEAHLVPRKTETMYGKFLAYMRSINPTLKVIGFTATPYRLDSGLLTEGKGALFDEVCHEISIRELVAEGYLAPLRSKATDTQLDVSNVKVRGGEYLASDLQAAVDKDDTNHAIAEEIVRAGADRKSWLIFCAGVEHAQHVADILKSRGVTTATVFGETPDHERDAAIARFKRGEVRAMVNVSVLTTGFDAPQVDLLAFLRPTKSTGLYVQMVGRAMRTAPGKADGLVLDFAGNVERHGPVDAVRIQSAGRGGDGDSASAPSKTCPECREIVAVATRNCTACDFEFPPPPPPEEKLRPKPSSAEVMSFGEPEWMDIRETEFSRHEKKGKPDSLRVDYWRETQGIDLYPMSEWVCLEHGGFAQQKAAKWWVQNGGDVPVPTTVSEAMVRAGELRKVTRIAVMPDEKNPKFSRIVRRELAERPLPWELPSRGADVEDGPWKQEEIEPCPF